MRVVYDLLSSRNRDEDDDTPAVFSLHENTPASFSLHETTASAVFSLPEATSHAASSSAAEVASMAARTTTRIRIPRDREVSSSSSSTVTSAKSSSETARASKRVKRRADDILSWLCGNGCASEVKIRDAIGHSPDTSKALRFLVQKDEVKRMGAGGRSDPFLYMVASKTEAEG